LGFRLWPVDPLGRHAAGTPAKSPASLLPLYFLSVRFLRVLSFPIVMIRSDHQNRQKNIADHFDMTMISLLSSACEINVWQFRDLVWHGMRLSIWARRTLMRLR
jgi:hypothetical protein